MKNSLLKWWSISIDKTLQLCASSNHGLSSYEALRRLKQKGPFSIKGVPNYKSQLLMYRVLRDGKTIKIPFNKLAFGDIVLCHKGDIVPANMRLLRVHNLVVQEVSVGGFANPAYKNTFTYSGNEAHKFLPRNMLYSGSNVISGNGIGIIVDKPIKSDKSLKPYNKYVKSGLLMPKKIVPIFQSSNLIIFDGLNKPSEIIASAQTISIAKQISCVYLLDHNLTIECGAIIPEASVNKFIGNNLISFFDISDLNKNKLVSTLNNWYRTLYIYSGNNYEPASSIARCDIVLQNQASGLAIIKAKIVAKNINLNKISSFLYNNN